MAPSITDPGRKPELMDAERLAEVKDLLKYESSIAFYSHRAKESLLLLVASYEAVVAERDRLPQQATDDEGGAR